MRVKRRTNVLLGLVLLAAALVVLLNMLHMIPAPVFDLFIRSWPVLLVLVGLTILLRSRVALGGLLALIISAGCGGCRVCFFITGRPAAG